MLGFRISQERLHHGWFQVYQQAANASLSHQINPCLVEHVLLCCTDAMAISAGPKNVVYLN